jgi:ligand-binding sensor domain-containing protein
LENGYRSGHILPRGIAHNHINRIRSDSRGFLWLCTDEGLSRFDGHSFTNYTVRDGLPHSWVNDLLETRDGAYLAATDGGVCRFHPTGKQRFRIYLPSARPGAARINSLLEDRDGDIWCGTYDALYRMLRTGGEDVRFIREEIGVPNDFYEGSLINSVFLDRRNTFWAASRSGLYRREKGGSWERYYSRRSEDPKITSPADRLPVYGQEDHVRAYGPDSLIGFANQVSMSRSILSHVG